MAAATPIPIPNLRRRRVAVEAPNLGLYSALPGRAIPERALRDCLNVRIENGALCNEQMGWSRFVTARLEAPVLGIMEFEQRNGVTTLIIGTDKDLLRYDDSGTPKLVYITPLVTSGTVAVGANGLVLTGTGTTWSSQLQPGDPIAVDQGALADADLDWIRIASVDGDTQVTLERPFTGDLSASGVSYIARRQLTVDHWSDATFPNSQPAGVDEWFATSGVEGEIVSWNGSAASVTIESLGFKCDDILFHRNVMLYGGVIEGPEFKTQAVKSSAIAIPRDTSTPNDAAEFAFTFGTDSFVRMEPLRDEVILYGKESIQAIQFVGAPLIWRIRTITERVGILGRNALVNLGEAHEILWTDRAYLNDGARVIEAQPHFMESAVRQIDLGRVDQVTGYRDLEKGEAIFVIPKVTDPVQQFEVTKGAQVGPSGQSFYSLGAPGFDAPVPGSIFINFGGGVTATDDGNGVLSGPGITGGIVDYLGSSASVVLAAPAAQVPVTRYRRLEDAASITPREAFAVNYVEQTRGVTQPVVRREIPAASIGRFMRSSGLRWTDITERWNELGFRWNDRFFGSEAPITLFGDYAGNLYQLGAAESQDGQPISSYAEFGRTRGVDGYRKARIHRVEPFLEEIPGADWALDTVLMTSDSHEGRLTEEARGSVSVAPGSRRFSSHHTTARFYALRFATAGVRFLWRLTGYSVELTEEGER